MTLSQKPLRAMVSYSHRDDAYRQELQVGLAAFVRQGLLDVWSDHKIPVGSELDKQIKGVLENVEIIILLISPDFIASDYCYSVELARAMSRHEENAALVVPIILRPCEWLQLPISRLKCLPADGKAISTWSNRDSAWLDVTNSLRELINDQASRAKSNNAHSMVSVREHLRAEFSRLHTRYESGPDLPKGILRSGISALDQCFDGFHNGDVIVFSSRANCGASDFLLQSAIESSCKQNARVLYVSPRDAGSRVMRRAICCIGHISREHLSSGSMTEEEWPRLTAAITLLSEAKMLIDDSSNPSALEMLARIDAVCASSSIDGVFIEGIDYFSASRGLSGMAEEAIAKRVRKLARDRNIPILISVPMTDAIERRSNRLPMLSDLGKWRCLEQEADQILLVHRDIYFGSGYVEDGDTYAVVAKNIHGVIGEVDIVAFPGRHSFGSKQSPL